MEKKDYIRNFLSKYIKSDSDTMYETITKYVHVDKIAIKKDRKEIRDFYRANLSINGLRMTYEELRYDSNFQEWIRLDNRRDLDLFEQLIAVGYEAGIFHESMVLKMYEYNKLTRSELKYGIPEEFEYIDEDYYNGLNEGIIKKNGIYIENTFYDNVQRTCSNKELLKYWFNQHNVPNAYEICEPFQYLLEHYEDDLVNIATYLFMQGAGPINLLLELNKNTHGNLVVKVEYIIKNFNKEQQEEFYKEKELFLNMLEVEYKSEIIQKKKGLR